MPLRRRPSQVDGPMTVLREGTNHILGKATMVLKQEVGGDWRSTDNRSSTQYEYPNAWQLSTSLTDTDDQGDSCTKV